MELILYNYIISVVVFSMSCMLFGILFSAIIFDKIMSINCFTNYVILLIVLIASFKNQGVFLDIALIYAFINFVATIGFLRYFKYRSFRN